MTNENYRYTITATIALDGNSERMTDWPEGFDCRDEISEAIGEARAAAEGALVEAGASCVGDLTVEFEVCTSFHKNHQGVVYKMTEWVVGDHVPGDVTPGVDDWEEGESSVVSESEAREVGPGLVDLCEAICTQSQALLNSVADRLAAALAMTSDDLTEDERHLLADEAEAATAQEAKAREALTKAVEVFVGASKAPA